MNRVDGGGAKNDFLLQSIANLTEKTVQRTATVEMASIGVALMAGLQGGVCMIEARCELSEKKQ